MTWEIALGIFALVAFVLGILGYVKNKDDADIRKMTEEQTQREEILQTLTKLNTTVENLNTTIEKFQTSSDRIHNELFERMQEGEKSLSVLSEKIKNLEKEIRK